MATLIRPSQINYVPSNFNLVSIADAIVTETTIASTSSKTTLYTFSVPAGTLSTNNILFVWIWGSFTNNSGSNSSVTTYLDYGATTLITSAATSNFATAATVYPFDLFASIKGDAATNAQKGYLRGTVGTQDQSGYGTSAEDSTAAKSLTVSWKHSNNNASTSVTSRVSLITYHVNT